MSNQFIPKPQVLLDLAKQNWKSGLTVALISIPLSIALSIASGAGPLPGIITGIWATALASLFGGSNYNIIGAAGALTTTLFAATLVAPHDLGPAVLPLLALVTGAIILVIWALRADRFLYYIPSSVMYGFAAGVAFLIAASQLFDATGLSALKRTGTFLGDIALFIGHAAETHLATLLTFGIALGFILIWKRYIKVLPAVIAVAVLGIIFGWLESSYLHLDLISLGDKFGAIRGSLIQPVAWDGFLSILRDSEALMWTLKISGLIALIAVLETLITAKIGDKITKTQSSSRRELLGLAIANLGSGSMGGLPATGVFIRTGANIKAGATHRMSAFIAALSTAIIALLVLPVFTYLPVAVIAAMLVNTAIGLIEFDKFKEFWLHEKESLVIALLVAVITVLHDAGAGVLVGVLAALALFVERVSHGRFDIVFNYPDGSHEEERGIKMLRIPKDKSIAIATYSIAGSLGYIDSARHAANFRHLANSENVKAVIIRLRELSNLDQEGAEMLAEAIDDLRKHEKRVCISSANEEVLERLLKFPSVQAMTKTGGVCTKAGEALKQLRPTLTQ